MSVKTLLIQAPAEDKAFFQGLLAKGEKVEIVEMTRFEGLPEIVQVIISLTTAITPILVAYFKEQTERAKARFVIKEGQKIRVSGYTAEEVQTILHEAATDEDNQ